MKDVGAHALWFRPRSHHTHTELARIQIILTIMIEQKYNNRSHKVLNIHISEFGMSDGCSSSIDEVRISKSEQVQEKMKNVRALWIISDNEGKKDYMMHLLAVATPTTPDLSSGPF
jgi:hypothetical protein